MLLGEPPPSQADLHFRLFGFPVRVHPFFWLVVLLLGIRGHQGDPLNAFIWVAVVFVSILVHELGHAVMQRYYGGHPWITLYGLGGLASCNDCNRSPRAQILILLAGPFAGFFLAAFVISILIALGRFQGFELSSSPVRWQWFDVVYAVQHGRWSPQDAVVEYLLFVNIFWGLVNLLPIYPLDGGQISRELLTLKNPRGGIVQSLQLSIGAAILVAIYALLNERFFLGIMLGFLAYSSYQTLQMYQNRWR